jgi:hypothetical protein
MFAARGPPVSSRCSLRRGGRELALRAQTARSPDPPSLCAAPDGSRPVLDASGPPPRVGLRARTFWSSLSFSRIRVPAARVGGGRVEAGWIEGSGAGGVGHGVVDLEDDALRPVFAVGLLVVLPHDGEGVEDVGGVVAGDAVEVKEGGVQLGAEEEAAGRVPAERRAVPPDVAGERLEVSGGVGQLEDARSEPPTHRAGTPRRAFFKCNWWENWELLGNVEAVVGAT